MGDGGHKFKRNMLHYDRDTNDSFLKGALLYCAEYILENPLIRKYNGSSHILVGTVIAYFVMLSIF